MNTASSAVASHFRQPAGRNTIGLTTPVMTGTCRLADSRSRGALRRPATRACRPKCSHTASSAIFRARLVSRAVMSAPTARRTNSQARPATYTMTIATGQDARVTSVTARGAAGPETTESLDASEAATAGALIRGARGSTSGTSTAAARDVCAGGVAIVNVHGAAGTSQVIAGIASAPTSTVL